MPDMVTATFEVTDWKEDEFDPVAGLPKLTRASVRKKYSGGVEGTSVTEWLMAYAADGTASFVGLERVTGTVAGRRGSLVLQHVGSYAAGAATAGLTVVNGGATEELAGATGDGTFTADPAGSVGLNIAFGDA